MIANPLVTDMAMQYGQDLVGRGQEELKKNLDKFVSIGQLKYYFAVDTNYVGRKIGETEKCSRRLGGWHKSTFWVPTKIAVEVVVWLG